MCVTCGCSGGARSANLDARETSEASVAARLVKMEEAVLGANDAIASRNRAFFEARGVLVLNLVSSPGSGKTTLLERTARELGVPVAVIEGDQETEEDARRIRATGAPAVQVNTGTGCHLDAAMIARAVAGGGGEGALELPRGGVLFIENVGNLVCPALFDLGEHAKVVVASTTEGEEKPLKYPHMYRAADLVVMNKVELAPLLDFDLEKARANAERVNPRLRFLAVSAKRGEGLESWYAYVRSKRAALLSGASVPRAAAPAASAAPAMGAPKAARAAS